MASEAAMELHTAMLDKVDYNYSQAELEELLPVAARNALIDLLQQLINNQLVKLAKSDTALFYQAVGVDEAEKIRRMSPDEALVYSFIQAAGREGIWTRTIKAKSNLHQNVVMRSLKSLENQRYIKAVKSVKFPTRKIYMLFSLQPSMEVTGGPWFTDSELDTEFIALLLRLVWQFVARATYPNAEPGVQRVHPPEYTGYPSLASIHEFVVTSGVSTVELAISDIRSLCDVLVADAKLELTQGDHYKATYSSFLAEQGVSPPISMLSKDVLPVLSRLQEEEQQ